MSLAVPSPPTNTTPVSIPRNNVTASVLQVADTAASHHFVISTAKYTDKKLANPGIKVLCPNHGIIESTHTAQLHFPHLPPGAGKAHVFSSLASGSLISIGQLCDYGCEAVFTATTVTIKIGDKLVCSGKRSKDTGLWYLEDPTVMTTTPIVNAAVVENDNEAKLLTDEPKRDSSSIPCKYYAEGKCHFGERCRYKHDECETDQPTLDNTVATMNAMVPTQTVTERVAFLHASMFSPALSTMITAIEANRLSGFPGLTAKQVRDHPPPSIAMVKGHLDQQRANLRSTKPSEDLAIETESSPSSPHASVESHAGERDLADDWNPMPGEPSADRSHFLYAACADVLGQVFTDQTGRFLCPSVSGNKEMLILYDYDSNYIHVEPMKDKTATEILAAYKRGHTLLSSRGLRPKLQRLDNEASNALQTFLTNEAIDYQLAPPHVHRSNAAERAIRTFKNHFIAGLCSTDPNFPLKLWDRLLPQALITLNLLRGSRINPQLSAWAQVNGAFDYNRTPLGPPGTKVLVHEKPSVRETWAPHAVEGWYLGPALKHYRCYRVWIPATGAERISDTLVWFPCHVKMPALSSTEAATAAARDLIQALSVPIAASPISPIRDSQLAAFQQLAEIFGQTTNVAPLDTIVNVAPNSVPPAITTPPGFESRLIATVPPATNAALPRVTTAAVPRVTAIAALPRVTTTATLPRVATVRVSNDPPLDEDGFTYVRATGNPRQRRKIAARASAKAKAATQAEGTVWRSSLRTGRFAVASDSATPTVEQVVAPPVEQVVASTPNTRSRSKQNSKRVATSYTANFAAQICATMLYNDDSVQGLVNGATTTVDKEQNPCVSEYYANAVVDPETGQNMSYAKLKAGPNGAEWEQAMANELGRLTKGVLPHMPTGTETMRFIHPSEMPSDRTATYLRIVAAERPHKEETKRIRCTVGGDRIDYPGNVSTKTADMALVKILLNSVVSTPGAKFATIDIKDFYLNTPMERKEYMRIAVKDIPDAIFKQYNLAPLVVNGFVYVEISKGMYGLPQAGFLANEQLKERLIKEDFKEAEHTPGLFLHPTRPVKFALTVDDFGTEYVGIDNYKYLVDLLRKYYKITEDLTGSLYCGLTLEWDYDARTVDVSMPGYIEKVLQRFQVPPPSRPQHSPHAWTAPTYGTAIQYATDEDTSDPLNAAEAKRLQEAIGCLLFYARACDPTMLVALGSLASAQSKSTRMTAKAMTQLLNYCATHPDATIRYHASDMCLRAHSDASYLSEREAKSRIGGYFFLSDRPQDPIADIDPDSKPPPFNGAILVTSSILKAVMSSATEAETGALFYNAKEACVLRNILGDMGYPQPATPIQTDNACAAGIINNTVKQRRSKAMDMKFYWVKDRVAQGQFKIHWRRGSDNKADYFTKHHSPSHHRKMRGEYLLERQDPPSLRGCVHDSCDVSTTRQITDHVSSMKATTTTQLTAPVSSSMSFAISSK